MPIRVSRYQCAGSIMALMAMGALMLAPTSPHAAPKRASVAKSRTTDKAQPTLFRPRLVQRDVLALFDSETEPAPAKTRVHKQLEMPLNHLGYRVDYHDVRSGLPELGTLQKYAAVVTWFGERVHDHRAYLAWADRAAGGGTRFIVIDFVGSPLSNDDLLFTNRFLKHIGIQARSIWVPAEEQPVVVTRDERMVDFEHKIDGAVPGFMVFDADERTTTSHLTVSSNTPTPGNRRPHRSDVVVTGPGGSFIQYGFGQIYDQKTERLKWITDPFQFLEKALGSHQQSGPIADTTTLAGRRIFFSHIDGDGWNNITEHIRPDKTRFTAAEIVRDRLIKKYSALPVSIGLIACDIEPRLGGMAGASLVARDLFEMRNVEVASHTHSHPYRWDYFRTASRDDEMRLHVARQDISAVDSNRPGETLPRLRSGFTATGPDMPRANFVEPFDLAKEVSGALESSSRLAPENKKAKLYLWSGDTSPFEQAIAATRDAGVRNMNGGDSRLDTDYPSVSYVPPIGKPVGTQRQIYAVNSNENTYTGGYSRDFGAQARVLETWANTDSPRRLKGMNAYYHMYAAQRAESLAAVDTLLAKARDSQVIPIPASQYAAIADSFYSIEFRKDGPDSWSIFNRGNLDTVRFDNSTTKNVDITGSSGVLGYTTHNTSLYVALDPANPQPRITLTTSLSSATTKPLPYLVESRWQLSQLVRNDCGFKVRASGFGPGDMTWRGMHPGRYTIIATSLVDQPEQVLNAEVSSDGALQLSIGADAISGLDLSVRCEFEIAEKSVTAETQPITPAVAAPSAKTAPPKRTRLYKPRRISEQVTSQPSVSIPTRTE